MLLSVHVMCLCVLFVIVDVMLYRQCVVLLRFGVRLCVGLMRLCLLVVMYCVLLYGVSYLCVCWFTPCVCCD